MDFIFRHSTLLEQERARTTINLVLIAMIATLYFVLVYALAAISFLPLQIRVADMLIMLPAVVGLPGVYGITLGCFVANSFPLGYAPNPIDVSLGSVANFIAGYLVYRLAYRNDSDKVLLASSLLAAITITGIVGSYLPIILGMDANIVTILVVGWLGVFPGEFISVVILGVPVCKVLKRSFKAMRETTA